MTHSNSIPKAPSPAPRSFDPGLYLVFDDDFLSIKFSATPANSYVEQCKTLLRDVLQGGITLLQLRCKNRSREDFISWAHALIPLAHQFRVPVLINDSVEVALLTNADGVHVGANDEHPRSVRQKLGPNKWVGVSLEHESDFQKYADEPVDYFALSAIFPTNSKVDLLRHWGREGIRTSRARTKLPLIAIGGIGAFNARAVLQDGADGLAVVSAILGAENPQKAAAELKSVLLRFRSEQFAQIENHVQILRRGLRYRTPRALTIAGSDSGGGAGIQTDLKTFALHSVFGTSVLTALTAQNTLGVQGVYEVSEDFIRQQLLSVLNDMGANAIKIGMLHRPEVIRVIAEELWLRPWIPVVLDPVMIAKGGQSLIQDVAVDSLIQELLPRVQLITPNLPEAERLLRSTGRLEFSGLTDADQPTLLRAAACLLEMGPSAVLIKGGHHASAVARDLLVDRKHGATWFESPRIESRNVHGTGCTLSSAIAANLALGYPVPMAVEKAKAFITTHIRNSSFEDWGSGHGPVLGVPTSGG